MIRKLWACAVLATAMSGSTVSACENGRVYAFQLSKPDQVRTKDLIIEDEDQLAFASRVSKATPVERAGLKRSQRSELRETTASVAARNPGQNCYSIDFLVSRKSSTPARGEKRARLTIMQFHQEDGRAALFFNIDPDGTLYAQFGPTVGKRRHVLVRDFDRFFGKWVSLRVKAHWSNGDDALTAVWIDLPNGPERLVLLDRGHNMDDGPIYQKLGVYRSFLERDPKFQDMQVRVRYRNIVRNGVTSHFDARKGR